MAMPLSVLLIKLKQKIFPKQESGSHFSERAFLKIMGVQVKIVGVGSNYLVNLFIKTSRPGAQNWNGKHYDR